MDHTPKQNKTLMLVVGVLAVLAVILACVVVIMAINAFSNNSGNATTPTPTPSGTTPTATATTSTSVTPSGSISPTPSGAQATIYFSQYDASTDTSTSVSVQRPLPTDGTSPYAFVLSQLLKGPTTDEKATGLFVPFTLSGSSTCGGSTYQFSINGSGKIAVKFCKTITEVQKTGAGGASAGSGLKAEARVLDVLYKSLTFGIVHSIEIRDSSGACYGLDAGDQNSCL